MRVARVVPLVVPLAPVADHVDDDVVAELLPVVEGEADDLHRASGSSPFTWKIGAWTIFATSVA